MVYHPTSRVLTVLELLQTYRQMNGRELAARLEVDVRTVRRYVTTLQDIGIPIEAEIGRFGGYALRPGFKLPPLMFSDDEVLVLTLGLLMARRSGVAGAGTVVESALAKIERVLPLALRDRLRALQETMRVDDAPLDILVEADVVALLSLASQGGRQTRLRYASPTGVTERVFDPYAVIHHQDRWYAVGYCHLREGLRTFRLDRAESVTLLTTSFTPPEDFDALNYLLSSFVAIPDRWNVEVWLTIPLEAARNQIPRELATLEEEDGCVRLRSSVADLDMISRRLIALACPITIVQPPELRQAFLQIAEEIRQAALS